MIQDTKMKSARCRFTSW